MSELGLGFLLFLLGIEMNIDEIKDILRPVTNIAIWQTVLQTALAFIIPLALGFTVMQTIIIALCTVFGATPVIVKLLQDKDEISTLPGKIDVGVLLLQDIYLVIILGLFSAESLSNPTEIIIQLAKVFALTIFIGSISLISTKSFLPKVFQIVSRDKHSFFIFGITWAFIFISASLYLDLSIEVGAFLAGLGLGQIPHRQELKERIRPITDFFMVIFFSSIALTINRENLFAYWQEAVIASIILMIGNFLIMFYLIDKQKFTPETSFIGSINMTQVSEFSLVVGALAVSQGYVNNDILGYLSLIALLTMPVSAYLINYNREIYEKVEHLLERFNTEEKTDAELRLIDNHLLIVGYDEIMEKTLPNLKDKFSQTVIVDKNTNNSNKLGKIKDIEYFYGDFLHSELRKTTGVTKAELIISSAPNLQLNKKILEETTEDQIVILKAGNIREALELYDMGADYVIEKNVTSSDRLSEYIALYFEDQEKFDKMISKDIEQIRWAYDG